MPLTNAQLQARHRAKRKAQLQRRTAALERAGKALGMFIMLIGEEHPGVGARIDAMLDHAAIQEALGAANEARAALQEPSDG